MATDTPSLVLPRRSAAAVAAVLTLAALAVAPSPARAVSDRARIPSLDFAGEATLAAGLSFEGTTVGGLSSITYDAARDVYYAVSDAQPNLGQGPFRFYTLRIDVADGHLAPNDVTVLDVTTFTDAAGNPLTPGTVDPEGLALTPRDTLILTSEGFSNATTTVAPFVREFGLDGRQLAEYDLPSYVDPAFPTSGVRQNLGLESAAFTPNGRWLFTGFENALVQDGPMATLTTGSHARLLQIDAATGEVAHEYVYPVDRVAEPPVPAGQFTVNGLVELLPFNKRFMLAMERSFSVGAGNTIRLHRVAIPGANDVAGLADLDAAGAVRPVAKTLVLDLDDVRNDQNQALVLDNLEGMTLGPRLPDGGRALVLVSDNNFTPGQVSQFLLFSADGVGPAS